MKPLTHAYAGAMLAAQLLVLLGVGYVHADRSSAHQPIPGRTRPEPAGWFAGDAHVHRGMLCARDSAKTMLSPAQLLSMMEPNDLAVISVLADIGNGEIRDAAE